MGKLLYITESHQKPSGAQLVTLDDLEKFRVTLMMDIKLMLEGHLSKPAKQWLKSYEVRKLLNISGGTLQTLRNNGKLPYTRIGGLIYYVTENGTGERDKELSFTISPGQFTKMFTGRSILPDTLEGFGELHELEKEGANPYARDNLWCGDCEQKFSRLEAIFSTNFPEKRLRDLPADLIEHHGQKLLFEDKFQYSIYEIFIQSIFWRCSASRFSGFALHPDVELKITKNLQEVFKIPGFQKLKGTEELPVMHSYPLVTSHLYTEAGSDPTANYIFVNTVRTPYFIMAGKWMFQLFEKSRQIRGTDERLFGLREAIDTVSIYPIVAKKTHMIALNKESSKSIVQEMLGYVVEKKKRGILRDIRLAYRAVFQKGPDQQAENYIYGTYFAHRELEKPEFESFVHAFHDFAQITGQ